MIKLGNIPKASFKKGQIPWNKGKVGLQKAWNKGLKGFRIGEKHDWMPKGDKHWSWKGGINYRDKHSLFNPDYISWRKRVFERDKFKCKMQNVDCVTAVQAHHILTWRDYPELRYNINNGITLCLAHHPRKRAEEKRLAPIFQELVSVSN